MGAVAIQRDIWHGRRLRRPLWQPLGSDRAARTPITLVKPVQVWVADITYVPTKERCVYLSLVTDAYSRKSIGHHVHASLRAEKVAEALKMVPRDRPGKAPLIHHSDRGVQYCASAYQTLQDTARKHGLTCSMTGWLRLLPERLGRAHQWHPKDRIPVVSPHRPRPSWANGGAIGPHLPLGTASLGIEIQNARCSALGVRQNARRTT